jgi:hypothetical protein
MIWNVRYHSWLFRFLNFIRWDPPWNSGTGVQALTDLEAVVAQGVRFYVFGSPLTGALASTTFSKTKAIGSVEAMTPKMPSGRPYWDLLLNDVRGIFPRFCHHVQMCDAVSRFLVEIRPAITVTADVGDELTVAMGACAPQRIARPQY